MMKNNVQFLTGIRNFIINNYQANVSFMLSCYSFEIITVDDGMDKPIPYWLESYQGFVFYK